MNSTKHYLGRFDDEKAAARAYDDKARQVYDNPILNFPPDGSLNPDRKKRIRSQSLVYRQQPEGKQSGDINQVEEDAVTISVKGEDGEQTVDERRQRRPRKRGRWGQQEEEDEVTGGVKTEEGTVVVKEEEDEEEEGEEGAGSA